MGGPDGGRDPAGLQAGMGAEPDTRARQQTRQLGGRRPGLI